MPFQKFAASILALLFSLPPSPAADDPWKKSWTQWTKAECEEVILASSPTASVREEHPAVDGTSVYIVGAPEIRVVVHWSTAITRRQANLRLKILSGEITEAQAQEGLRKTREHIILQVMLLSNVQAHFRDKEALEKVALSTAYLFFPRSKTKVSPVKVEVFPRPGFEEPALVRLYFPRLVERRPVVEAEEKNVALVWPRIAAGFKALNVEFALAKLAADPANEL